MTRAIDCLVNVDFGDVAKQPEYMVRVKEDYFKGGDSFFKSPELDELIEDMDANGVEKAILVTRASATVRNIRWFEVIATRGFIERDGTTLFQVTLKIGFTIE